MATFISVVLVGLAAGSSSGASHRYGVARPAFSTRFPTLSERIAKIITVALGSRLGYDPYPRVAQVTMPTLPIITLRRGGREPIVVADLAEYGRLEAAVVQVTPKGEALCASSVRFCRWVAPFDAEIDLAPPESENHLRC